MGWSKAPIVIMGKCVHCRGYLRNLDSPRVALILKLISFYVVLPYIYTYTTVPEYIDQMLSS